MVDVRDFVHKWASGVILTSTAPADKHKLALFIDKYDKAIKHLKMIERGKFTNGDVMKLMDMRSFACNTLAELDEL